VHARWPKRNEWDKEQRVIEKRSFARFFQRIPNETSEERWTIMQLGASVNNLMKLERILTSMAAVESSEAWAL